METRPERRAPGALGGQAAGEPPEQPQGRVPREGVAPTEGPTMVPGAEARPVSGPSFTGEPFTGQPFTGEPIEPLEPGGEVGETREVPEGGSAEEMPGRRPRTRVEVHGPGRGPRGPRPGGDEEA
jgi:hypothetical protein